MAAILDVVFSIVLGGMLLMIILTANEIASDNHSIYNGDMLVQEMLISTAQLVEGEFRNMGFGVPEGEKTILQADTNRITFLSDLNRDGTPENVVYAVGETSELSSTQNENDRYLHRIVNGGAASQVGVVTHFSLRYMTRSGEVLATPVLPSRLTEIHVVEVTMEVQNPYAPQSRVGGDPNILYSSSLWQHTRLASQNSRR